MLKDKINIMDSVEQQVIERLKQANNVLVTVSANPSVDQLAACIGLTLMLNKLGKHGTAVFSGQAPSTIEFLQPEKTLEKNTDSLQDFIIALDKSKADKLRYKVEDNVVKIFITPYKTSISEKDLKFSQGDFNVDVVMALGVKKQEDLDQAIVAHGRILHDATVISVNDSKDGKLGSINWQNIKASSLCEMAFELGVALNKDVLDQQIATALLTGIVAETNRFSNDRTFPRTMTVSAALMAAGANQQLVATKLAPPPPKPPEPHKPIAQSEPAPESPKPKNDGTLEIKHQEVEDAVPPPKPAPLAESEEAKSPEPSSPSSSEESANEEAESSTTQSAGVLNQIDIDENGTLRLNSTSEQSKVEPPSEEQPSADQPNIKSEAHGGYLDHPPTSVEPDELPSGSPNPNASVGFASAPGSSLGAPEPGMPTPLLSHHNDENLEPKTDENAADQPPTAHPTVDHARGAVEEALAAQSQAQPKPPVPIEPEQTPNTLDMPAPPSVPQPEEPSPPPQNGPSGPPPPYPPPFMPPQSGQ